MSNNPEKSLLAILTSRQQADDLTTLLGSGWPASSDHIHVQIIHSFASKEELLHLEDKLTALIPVGSKSFEVLAASKFRITHFVKLMLGAPRFILIGNPNWMPSMFLSKFLSYLGARLIILDDGAVSVRKWGLYRRVFKSLGQPRPMLFTKYKFAIPYDKNVLCLPNQMLRKVPDLDKDKIGFLGTPVVENRVISIDKHISNLERLKDNFGVERVLYFPHRREDLSWEAPDWMEIIYGGQSTVEKISEAQRAPFVIATYHSSAILDLQVAWPGVFKFAILGQKFPFKLLAWLKGDSLKSVAKWLTRVVD